MNRGRSWSGGYTIVETMIFLAVTGALLISAMLFLGGQQRKAEFSQAVRDFASSLQDIANDVSTGYAAFPFGANSCWTNGSSIRIQPDPGPGGSYVHCMFIGRVLQFSPGGTGDAYQVYSVVGRQTYNGEEVTTLSDASPLALAPGNAHSINPSGTDYSQQLQLSGGVTVGWVRQGGTAYGGFGFFTTFASYVGGSIQSTSTHADVIPVSTSNLGEATKNFVDKVDNASHLTTLNPALTVCLNSGGTDQHAEVGLGGSDNGTATVNTVIKDGPC